MTGFLPPRRVALVGLAAFAAPLLTLAVVSQNKSGGGASPLIPNNGAKERVCESPDCLVVENVHSDKGRVASIGVLDTRLLVFIEVAPRSPRFTLFIYDQADDTPENCAKPSRFTLLPPHGGGPERVLDASSAPKSPDGWSSYEVDTKGQAGVWRLAITGPEDKADKDAPRARNAFRLRTQGAADMFLLPAAVARVRGLRFAAPQFSDARTHRFLLSVPGGDKLRVHLLRPSGWREARVSLTPPPTASPGPVTARQTWATLANDDRLAAGFAFSTLDVQGAPLRRGLWTLTTAPQPSLPGTPGETYGFGLDGGQADGALRVYFPARDGSGPLAPLPVATPVALADRRAARLTVAPVGAEPPLVVDTDSGGRATLYLPPGPVKRRVVVTRGPQFTPQTLVVTAGKAMTVPALRRRVADLPGWAAGDPHCHTTFYDGTDTPAQMVAAARAEGLSWLIVSEHGHGVNIGRVERANREALAASLAPPVPGGFLCIPGMEYTTSTYHANVLGGFVRVANNGDLPSVLVAAQRAEAETGMPVAVALNHPTIGATAAGIGQGAAARNGLSLVELWNSSEPNATQLWWEMLNAGHRVWAETGSDSHNRINAPLGRRRTFVYLGDKGKMTSAAVVGALRTGHSFLSRNGATLDFRVENARPGATVTVPVSGGESAPLHFRAAVRAAVPLARVDIIYNGAVVRSLPVNGQTQADFRFSLPSSAPGWYLAQAWARGDNALPVALCNPVYVSNERPQP